MNSVVLLLKYKHPSSMTSTNFIICASTQEAEAVVKRLVNELDASNKLIEACIIPCQGINL